MSIHKLVVSVSIMIWSKKNRGTGKTTTWGQHIMLDRLRVRGRGNFVVLERFINSRGSECEAW
jgi:hypothetical protein